MSDVVDFLETMGQSCELRYAAKPTLYKTMQADSVSQAAQWAILRGDDVQLRTLLDANEEMVCVQQVGIDELSSDCVDARLAECA